MSAVCPTGLDSIPSFLRHAMSLPARRGPHGTGTNQTGLSALGLSALLPQPPNLKVSYGD